MSGRLGREQRKKLEKAIEQKQQQTEIEHVWREGYRCKVHAKTAAEEIRRLIEANGTGGVTANEVVDAARPESSPIHRAFEWDDAKAAEQFRLDQARHVVRNVMVVNHATRATYPEFIFVPYKSGIKIAPNTQVEVGDVSEDGSETTQQARPRGSYEITEHVAKDPDKLALAVSEMQSSINSARRKLDDVRQFVSGSDSSGQMAMLVQLGTTLETALELSRRIH